MYVHRIHDLRLAVAPTQNLHLDVCLCVRIYVFLCVCGMGQVNNYGLPLMCRYSGVYLCVCQDMPVLKSEGLCFGSVS